MKFLYWLDRRWFSLEMAGGQSRHSTPKNGRRSRNAAAKRKNEKAYYAVSKGRTLGIFKHWSMCARSVDGFSGNRYKGFESLEDAIAFLAVDGITTEQINVFTSGDVKANTPPIPLSA